MVTRKLTMEDITVLTVDKVNESLKAEYSTRAVPRLICKCVIAWHGPVPYTDRSNCLKHQAEAVALQDHGIPTPGRITDL